MSGASLEILIAPWHCRLVLRHMVFYSSRSLQSSQHPQIINDLKIFLCSRCFNRLLGGTGLARYTLLDCQSKYWGKRFYFFFKRGLRMLSVFNRCIFFFFCMFSVSFHHRNADVFLLTCGVLQKYIKGLCSRKKESPAHIVTASCFMALGPRQSMDMIQTFIQHCTACPFPEV